MELRKRRRTRAAETQRVGGHGYKALDGFYEQQREHHRGVPTPPPPFEEVEARRGPGRKRKPRNRRHGRPRGRMPR